MNQEEKQAFIFATILTLANRLQIVGDKLDKNITLKQWLLIAIILKNGSPAPTLGEVAGIFGCSRQNIKKLAMILEKQGFVALKRDEQDARVVRVQLTSKCHAYFKGREDLENELMQDLFHHFDEKLTDGLFYGIQQLADNLGRIEENYRARES
ncbi:MarR family transcriptional regulator [Paenibacillus sp. alder61]|uniref:MarR family transcriptional regulator n=1 Tax=Paenibacillus faecis TaxID=862114 RepID=A0A5D0CT48_9BACL|nr:MULTISPECIES: MarR family transcriptional regulator [Paenibacillus]MCA1292873.1 MarR family transcriptional regulator [Paenibacillus sp. alder61]TYA12838.1 MarR family transcriptional regulator [Paenibacillus faecis]